jgi:cell wall-associated NlpC family hydrolase
MRRRRTTTTWLAAACAATLLAGTTTTGAHADHTRPRTLAEVRTQVNELYRKAEVATDAYNAAHEKVIQQQKDIVTLAKAIDKAQTKLKTLAAQAGALAAAQYRSGGTGTLDSELQLLLGGDTDAGTALDGAALTEKAAHAANTTISELTTTKSELDTYAGAATTELANLTKAQQDAADAKQQITTRLAQAKALLSTLQAQQKARLDRLEDEAAYQSQITWLTTDAASQVTQQTTTATAQGRQAVAYATAQLGKPYEWGAEGPRGFDCSGLTEQAWKAAGITIPRTAEQQWRQLPHVPVARMRPGDLVIYYDDASHVAIYIGDGAIIQAPRPGRTITVAGVGSMPILGVVRPGSTV